ncbi:hypothetical protein B0H16DRAFT_1804550 [Mycena metata]|uniref:MYND-type domain-containing protein n=1 Tax=Mycena metata TaxID=1033252 RepID=A0AAD7NJH8_9AGAR|nr:hypothetical protein B0H16DRAFT_1804550 [Mycena metata]
MTATMHSAIHVQLIARRVAKFQQGIFEDDIRFHECGSCHSVLPVKVPLRCSACRVIRYCNLQCQKKHWKEHKGDCKDFQALPNTEPQMCEIAQQFPWARLQADNTFSFETLRASRGLLGTGAQFGWWTEEPCCLPKDSYLPGFALLDRQTHLTERLGWKLTDKETPWLDFSLSHNWAGYYEWRGLPIESPAALLLHWPLTVYRLLTIAGVIPARASEARRQLTVHMLGIEREMDFLPVMPNTDLNLVLFGHGVANLLKKVKDQRCLAAQPVVFEYTAPKVSGGGRIRISLYRRGSFWDYSALMRDGVQRPDALVACNAGISTYPQTWTPVVLAARAFAIPFAVTDYNAISLRNDIKLTMARLPDFVWMLPVSLSAEERRRVDAAPTDGYDIGLNPFMQPGPRPTTFGGTSAVNGYEMVISRA